MKRHTFLKSAWLVAGLGFLLLAWVGPTPAWAHGPGDGGAQRDDIQGLFDITLWMAIPVFLLVEGLILFAIIRFRRRRADEVPEQVEGNRPLEITWTVLSFVIIAVLFLLTMRALSTDYEVAADGEDTPADLTVHVTAYMFNWDFEYFLGEGEETGLVTTRTLTIPADRNVFLEITSSDVQHSFWLPDVAGKVDAIPGYTNGMWLNVDEPGRYEGNCAEYCGTLHYNMLIELQVLEPAEFDAWLAEKMAASGRFVPIGTDTASPLPAGEGERGEQLFSELGCASCHGPQDGVGPSLPNIKRDTKRMEDYTPEEYLRSSILVPCEYETGGYNCQVMPADYGEKLDAQALADLIAYLLED